MFSRKSNNGALNRRAEFGKFLCSTCSAFSKSSTALDRFARRRSTGLGDDPRFRAMSSTIFPPRFLHRFNRSAVCPTGTKPASGSFSAIRPAQGRGFCRLWQFRNVEQQDEADFGDKGPLYRDRKLAQVEAVLFLVRAPLTSRKIAQLAGLADGTEARKLVRRLKLLLREGQSAFQVEEVAGGYQLLTCAEVSPWLGRFFETPARPRLSAPAMETLAVVAYRQPILRAEIEAIRGVQCDDILRQLLDRDLIRIIGRSEDLGRPLLYGTTRRFLELFGLRNLEELPRAVKRSWASEPEQIKTPIRPHHQTK